jgi:hypothetical protein
MNISIILFCVSRLGYLEQVPKADKYEWKHGQNNPADHSQCFFDGKYSVILNDANDSYLSSKLHDNKERTLFYKDLNIGSTI